MGGALPVSLRQDVWRGHRLNPVLPAISTGIAKLDRYLPGQGWPLGALTELLTAIPGTGEFSLLLPVMARLTSARQWLALIDPPWVPYPPAMQGHGIALDRIMLIRTGAVEESLWACEQALRGMRGGAVLAWPGNPGFTRLRRLQLAAQSGRKAAFLFRPLSATRQPSPAVLRLHLGGEAGHTRIAVLKCRGPRPAEPLLLRRSRHLPGRPVPAAAAGGSPAEPLLALAGDQAQPDQAHAH